MSESIPLAFAHANGFPGGSYRHFLEAFEPRYQVHAVDRLGHDPDFPVDAHWHNISRELESFLEGLPRPLVGLGHSMGGVALFMVASRRPEWFRALVMLEPPLINGPDGLAFNLLRRLGQVDRISPAGKSLGRRDHWPDRAEAQAYFQRRALFQRFDPQCLSDYLDAGLEPDGEGWRLRFRPSVEVALFRTTPGNLWRFPRLRVPGAVINAAESGPMFHRAGRRHARRHRMRHEMVPGGHLFPLEQPGSSAERVMTILDELLTGETHERA